MVFLLCSSCIKHLCGFPSKFFKSKSGPWGEKEHKRLGGKTGPDRRMEEILGWGRGQWRAIKTHYIHAWNSQAPKNVEPEPNVAIRVYNPALGRLREENFELDISPDFTVRHYLKEGKKYPTIFNYIVICKNMRHVETAWAASPWDNTKQPP